MAIENLFDYKSRLSGPRQKLPLSIASSTVVIGRPFDLWAVQTLAGAAPTTAVVPTRTTVGALGQENPSAGQLSILGAEFAAMNPGVYLICDRLSHQGGLSGIVTTAQTTNLATAALTRYTDGVGVMMGLTVYSAVGTTGTTVTVSYTNQANTSGRTSPAVVFGGTGFREANRMILLPLQAGDTGVRAVASVTVLATTGTAGNFGVTLFKPLFAILVDSVTGVSQLADFVGGRTSGGIPAIVNDACLFPMAISAATAPHCSGVLITSEN